MLQTHCKFVAILWCWEIVFGFNIDVSPGAVTTFKINVTGAPSESSYAGYRTSAFVNNSHFRLLAGAPQYKRDPFKPYVSEGSVIQCTANIYNGGSEGFVYPATAENNTKAAETTTTPAGPTANKTANGPDNGNIWMSNPYCKVILSESSVVGGSAHVNGSGSLGSTLFQTAGYDKYTVCAPRRKKQCGETYNLPGACYTGTFPNKTTWLDWKAERSCYKNYVDVIFVVDSSGSISSADFETMKEVMLNLSNSFEGFIEETAQVGILQYGDNNRDKPNYASFNTRYYKTPLTLGKCKTVQCIKTAIRTKMTHMYSGNTFTALAIERAVKHKDFQGNPNAKKFLVLITDGQANDWYNLETSYILTRDSGITVYAVGVGADVNITQLRISANGDVSNDRVLTTGNYGLLSQALSNITNEITQSGAEGEQSTSVEESLINNVFGFSGHHSKNGLSVIGAVGSYRNLGTLAVYNSTTETFKSTLTFSNVTAALTALTNATYDCFLGYAITSGKYQDKSTIYIAASAPRYLMHGAVVVFDEGTMGTTEQIHYKIEANECTTCQFNHRQIGSYFGGSLLTADFNNDGFDDLLVGAPLYIGNTYDEGRVFVYLSKGNNTLEVWSNSTYTPTVLDGKRAEGGRFGYTMAALGDLNNDGYQDLIAAAPWAENGKGVVYVYHGSSSGLTNVVQQTVSASITSQADLVNFGISLEGGIDVDGNLYPDVLVSAPTSDQITILRTRPVVNFYNYLNFSSHKIDILKCLNLNATSPCAILQSCLRYDGKSVEPFIEINYNLTIDPELKRFFVKAKTTLILNTTLTKGKEACFYFEVIATNKTITDFDSKIFATLTYALTQKHITTPVSSMGKPLHNNSLLASAMIEKSCGLDDTCQYDLVVTAKSALPKAGNISQSSSSIFKNESLLVVGSDDPIILKVNITNIGDNAFGVQTLITHSVQLLWTGMQNMTSSNPSYPNCVSGTIPDTVKNNERTKTLTYKYDDQLKSIMLNGSWCYFEVILSTMPLKNSGSQDKVEIRIKLNTSINGSAQEENPMDNTWNATYLVLYRSDFTAQMKTDPYEVVFNFIKEEKNISSVYEIGVNTTDVIMDVEIQGNGYSNIPHSSLTFKYPSELNGQHPLLYPIGLECVSLIGIATSYCNQTNINPFNLDILPAALSNRTDNLTTVAPNPFELELEKFDCTGNSTVYPITKCDVATCQISNLRASDVIRCKATFRIWTQTLNLTNGTTSVSYLSEVIYDTSESQRIINAKGTKYKPTVLQVSTVAKLYVAPTVFPPTVIAWWIYLVASVAGILFFAVLVAILYKLGFFKSKYGEMKDELEWQVVGEGQPTETTVFQNATPSVHKNDPYTQSSA